jgi:Putative helicase
VGDQPASADHHHSGPGGLYRHSLEVALKTLEEFEGNIIMERWPDGSVDSSVVPAIGLAGNTPRSLPLRAMNWGNCLTWRFEGKGRHGARFMSPTATLAGVLSPPGELAPRPRARHSPVLASPSPPGHVS